jgi:hypothetical protein
MSESDRVPSPVVEVIPSVQDGISAIASSHAPFLYFEAAPTAAHLNGIIRVTLTAARDLPMLGVPGRDHVIVAHLRMNIPAALALKATLESVLLLAQPALSETRN